MASGSGTQLQEAVENLASSSGLQHRGGDPNPLDTEGLCLLSLDGGGVRGLSSLYVLRGVMILVNDKLRERGLPPKKPCEIFDLIGGTSTGGLIAIMLGRLEMDVDTCIQAYEGLMKSVFKQKKRLLPVTLFGKVAPRFDSEKLKLAIERVIRSCDVPITELFNDHKERGCKVFVCAAASETTNITRLRSYDLLEETSINATICEAALATSAATGFFSPVSIGAREFVDGALSANNPVMQVEGEASNIWCPNTGNLKPQVKCFISIGTGTPGTKAIEDKLISFLSKTLVALATETEATAKDFIANWRQHVDERKYFRFNVQQGLQDVGLDEFKDQGKIEAVTAEYLSNQEQKFKVRDCVANLQQKENRTTTQFGKKIEAYDTSLILNSGKMAIHSHFIVTFERNWDFIHREGLMTQLQSLLERNKGGRRVALWGLGGIGKSQIALQYAYTYHDSHPETSVFWVSALSAQKFEQDCRKIAQQVKIPGWNDPELDAREALRTWFNSKESGKWLFVVDNADDADIFCGNPQTSPDEEAKSISRFMPNCAEGSVLLTTRNRKVAINFCQAKNSVEVGQMSFAEVESLFKSRSGQENYGENDFKEFIELLESLPLAIAQAASYMAQNTTSLASYLESYKEGEANKAEFLSEHFEEPAREPETRNPVATTLLISFEQIAKQNSLAAALLSLMGCLSRQSIPESLLFVDDLKPPELVSEISVAFLLTQGIEKCVNSGSKSMSKPRLDAFGTLQAYSLIRKNKDDTFEMHRLVHLALRQWLRKHRKFEENARACLELRWYQKELDYISLMAPYGLYLPQAVTALGNIDELELSSMDRTLNGQAGDYVIPWLSLARGVGYAYVREGKYAASLNWHRKVQRLAQKVFGNESAWNLQAMADIGLCLGNTNQLREAEMTLRDCLHFCDSPERPPDYTTWDCMRVLACTLARTGDFDEAERLLRRVLDGLEKLPTRDQNLKHVVAVDFADLLNRQGKYREAEETLRPVVLWTRENYGDSHVNTIYSKGTLAGVLAQQGNYDEAEAVWQGVWASSKEIGCQEHPAILAIKHNAALALAQQGKFVEAEQMFREVEEARVRVLGANDHRTRATTRNVAIVLVGQKKDDEAEARLRSLLNWNLENCKEDSIEILVSLDDLGRCLEWQKKFEEDVEVREEFFSILSHELSKVPPKRIPQSKLVDLRYYKWARGEIMETGSSGADGERSIPSMEEVVEWYSEYTRGLSVRREEGSSGEE